jgi:hypothetical protein
LTIHRVEAHRDAKGKLCSEFIWVGILGINKPIQIVYCRVSTQAQVYNSSFEKQITNCKEPAINLIIIEVGSAFHYRKGFDTLLKLLRNGTCQVDLMAYDMNRLVRNEVDYEKLLRFILLDGHYLTAYPFMFDSSISGTTVGETLLDAVKHCHNLNQESKLMQPRPQGSLNSKNMDRKSMLTIKLYNKCLKVMSKFPVLCKKTSYFAELVV